MIRQTFDLQGVSFRISSVLPKPLAALQDRLAPYLTTNEAVPDIEFFIKAAPPRLNRAIQEIPQKLRWIRSRPLWAHMTQQTMELTDGASLARIGYLRRQANLYISEETMVDEHFFVRTFLLLPLVELLRTQDFFYLHAALVTYMGRSMLILGEGKSGKSTLAAAALLAGGQLMGDDNLLLHGSTGEVFPLEQELAVSAEVMKQLGLFDKAETYREKYRLPLPALSPKLRTLSALPTDLILLRPGADNGLAPLARSEAFHLLVTENPLLLAVPHLAPLHMASLKKLVHRCRCFELRQNHTQPPQLDNLSLHFPQWFQVDTAEAAQL